MGCSYKKKPITQIPINAKAKSAIVATEFSYCGNMNISPIKKEASAKMILVAKILPKPTLKNDPKIIHSTAVIIINLSNKAVTYFICQPPSFLHVFSPIKDRKSTRLNSSHVAISYAVFCLKKQNKTSHS